MPGKSRSDLNAEADLLERIRACRECRGRFPHEPRPVVRGHPTAPLAQISQAPSRSVHESGFPFDDASGEKLRGEWYGIDREGFYDPSRFYITSVGKCFPGKTPRGGDRKPPKICADLWLEAELKRLENTIFLIVGKAAADYFFPGETFHELVMHTRTLKDKDTFVLPHPSPLNIKWFKDHPEFFHERLPSIRKRLHQVLFDKEP